MACNDLFAYNSATQNVVSLHRRGKIQLTTQILSQRHDEWGQAMFDTLPEETEQVVSSVMDVAFKVHRTLGPGLLESVYEVCLCHELAKQIISFQRQLSLPVVYEGVRLDAGLRLDLLVEDSVIVELKAVETLKPLFDAQLLTYFKLTGKRIGLPINFNPPALSHCFKKLFL